MCRPSSESPTLPHRWVLGGWVAPQPALPWKGVLDATDYGQRCMQGKVFADMLFQDPSPSEDCLSLNVFVPRHAKTGAKLPVMFWIHGGGYAGGGSSEAGHNGDYLPGKGIVLVTINYRLGAFGFLALPGLAAEQGGSSGNYGLMDMVAALHWVIAYGTWKWMEYQRQTAYSPVYCYRLDLAPPPTKFHPEAAAFHSDDIEYVFGTLDTRPGSEWRDSDRKLSEQIMSYWTNFAKSGDPNGPGLPAWPAYSESDAVLHLDNPISARPDENRPRYEFLVQFDTSR
jgi:carboxylesterase type B